MGLNRWLCCAATIILTLLFVNVAVLPQDGGIRLPSPAMASTEKQAPGAIVEPPATSSPRATLNHFLINIDRYIQDWKRDKVNPESEAALARAAETLNYTTSSNPASWINIVDRLLLLKECLDRIDIPPIQDIPGDQEVADRAITLWTIPGTRIAIERIQHGPRDGEFLFSAATVQNLRSFYLLAKDLPYKPGASVGVFEEYRNFIRSNHAMAPRMKVRDLLSGIDATSPRNTLEYFLRTVQRAYELTMVAEEALTANPPTMTKIQARAIEDRASNLLRRAQSTLDVSQLPEAIRDSFSFEAVLHLKEVLDRTLLPPLMLVPDQQMVEAARKGEKGSFLSAERPLRWRYPDTEIEIVEITEGEKKGQFLFSSDTVARIGDMYEKVRHIHYRQQVAGPMVRSYLRPGISKDFYHFYISTPGYLVPHAHFLIGLYDTLPGWMNTLWNGQTIWQWMALFICLGATVLIIYGFFRFILRIATPRNQPYREWLLIFSPLTAVALISLAIGFIDFDLKISGKVMGHIKRGGELTVVIMLAWAVVRLCTAIAETIVASPTIDPKGIQASYTRAFLKLIGFTVAGMIILAGLSRIGVSLIPLLTGVGIGGLAVALAARPTMENIIASVMIFLDKPYKVGHRIKVKGQDGIVESIGLRSTKIRLLSGPLTSIPNEKMAVAEVENVGRRPFIRRRLNIAITIDTPPEKIERALELLRKMLSVPDVSDAKKELHEKDIFTSLAAGAPPGLAAMIADIERDYHPNMAINNPKRLPRVYFNDLNADSLNILVLYWYHPPKYWAYMKHANWLNLQIMKRFNAEGIEFAFPTQTLHLAGDDKRPLTVGQRQVVS